MRYCAAPRAAQRREGKDSNGTNAYTFFLTDHLPPPLRFGGASRGSTTLTVLPNGVQAGRMLYRTFGEQRYSSGTTPTGYRFTGQLAQADVGLYYYGARWYDPQLGRFTSPDTIVPLESQGVQAWDRYAYVNNSPVNFNDPSGHKLSQDDRFDPPPPYLPTPTQPSLPVSSPILAPNINNTLPSPFLTGQTIDNQCTQTYPCISAWENPTWWDTDASNPDYYVLSVNSGSVGGVTFIVVMDRYGNVYLGVGGNIGKSISSVTISFNGGWVGSMIDDDIPDQGNIDTFLTGLAINGQLGIVGNVAFTWSPLANDYIDHSALEYGGVIPFSLGGSATYGFKIFDGFSLFGSKK